MRTSGLERGEARTAAAQPVVEALSLREVEILALLSRALSAKSIARSLNLSPGTIKWHLRNVYAKLGANSREVALSRARALRILC